MRSPQPPICPITPSPHPSAVFPAAQCVGQGAGGQFLYALLHAYYCLLRVCVPCSPWSFCSFCQLVCFNVFIFWYTQIWHTHTCPLKHTRTLTHIHTHTDINIYKQADCSLCESYKHKPGKSSEIVCIFDVCLSFSVISTHLNACSTSWFKRGRDFKKVHKHLNKSCLSKRQNILC